MAHDDESDIAWLRWQIDQIDHIDHYRGYDPGYRDCGYFERVLAADRADPTVATTIALIISLSGVLAFLSLLIILTVTAPQ
jgi:hypothetical protein